MAETICNGKASNLPSLEVVKQVQKPLIQMENMNFLLHHYYARQDFDRCKTLIESECDVNPEYLYFIKGLIEKKEEKYTEALKSFQKSIDMNSNNLETYKEIGKTLFCMGRFKPALGVFREAERMSSRPDAEIFHYIGELLHRNLLSKELESTATATATATTTTSTLNEDVKMYFQKAVQHGRKLASYQKLAEIYRHERDYEKSIEILENCLQITPDNTEILTEIGVLYLKVNDAQRAFDKLFEITGINDKCPRGLLAFGAILQSRNDVDGALGKYKEITGDDIECPELWNNIGLCFFKKKKLIVAIACLRKSIWLSPLNYNSLYNNSLIFITAQQYASAFHILAAAINLRKDSAECYMLLGICLRYLKDWENAFAAFERATVLPDANINPLVYLNFGIFCYQYGRIDMASTNFHNFVQVSQNLILPTEYKYHATKLKAVLQNHKEPESIESVNAPPSRAMRSSEQEIRQEQDESSISIGNRNHSEDNEEDAEDIEKDIIRDHDDTEFHNVQETGPKEYQQQHHENQIVSSPPPPRPAQNMMRNLFPKVGEKYLSSAASKSGPTHPTVVGGNVGRELPPPSSEEHKERTVNV